MQAAVTAVSLPIYMTGRMRSGGRPVGYCMLWTEPATPKALPTIIFRPVLQRGHVTFVVIHDLLALALCGLCVANDLDAGQGRIVATCCGLSN
jgi:hypothetical protein